VCGAPVLIGFAVTDNAVLWLGLRFLFQYSLTTAFVLSEYWINVSPPAVAGGLIMGIYATSLCLGFAAGPVLLGLTESGGLLPVCRGGSRLPRRGFAGRRGRRQRCLVPWRLARRGD
jgi:hypothetical protein